METNEGIKLQGQIRNLLAALLVVAIFAIVVFAPGWTFGSQQSEWLNDGWLYLEQDEKQSFFTYVPNGQELTVKVDSDNNVVIVCDGYTINSGGYEDAEACFLTEGNHELKIYEHNGFQGYVLVELDLVSEEPAYEDESAKNYEASSEISFGSFIEIDVQDTDYFSGYLTDDFYVFEIVGADYEIGLHGFASGVIFDTDGNIMREFQETDYYTVLDEGKYFFAFTERDQELWISFDSTYQVWDSSDEHTVQAGSTYEFEVSVTETTIFAVESDGDARIEIYDGGGLAQTVDNYVSGEDESFTLEPGDYTLKVTEWSGDEMNFIIKSRAE